jgi:hypothetical protein
MHAVLSSRVDADMVKRALLGSAEAVCRHLLPAGKREGKEWRCGNLRGDPGHSLSVNLDSGVFEDFATSEKAGNLLELWRQVRGVDFATALREAAAFIGQAMPDVRKDDDDAARKRSQWPAFEKGNRRERLAVASLRGIAPEGIELASERGHLLFADWRNSPCWIITDSRRANAQARRIDGKPFVVEGESRKAITLPGSRAGIPIGLNEAREFPNVAIVEGGPDLLAAHGVIWAEDRKDVAAVAMLGAGHRPSVAAWSALAGKTARIYCHRDTHGMKAGQEWGQTILAAGASKIDGFRFDGLRKVDGADVEDLNDLLALHPDDSEARRDVWEILP